jgi:hypothetical protein
MEYELHGMKVGDPCPQCDMGLLEETEFGLSCDTCQYDDVDQRKFERKDNGDSQEA